MATPKKLLAGTLVTDSTSPASASVTVASSADTLKVTGTPLLTLKLSEPVSRGTLLKNSGRGASYERQRGGVRRGGEGGGHAGGNDNTRWLLLRLGWMHAIDASWLFKPQAKATGLTELLRLGRPDVTGHLLQKLLREGREGGATGLLRPGEERDDLSLDGLGHQEDHLKACVCTCSMGSVRHGRVTGGCAPRGPAATRGAVRRSRAWS